MNLHGRLAWLTLVICSVLGCGVGKEDSKKDAKQSPQKKIVSVGQDGKNKSVVKPVKSANKKGNAANSAKKTQQKAKKGAASKKATGIYKYVYTGIQSMLIVRPQQATKHAMFALFPAQALDEMFRLDLKRLKGIKQITAFMPKMTDMKGMPPFALLFEFVSADAAKEWRTEITAGEKRKVAGKTVYSRKGEPGALAHAVSEKVLIMGSSKVVEQMLLENGATSDVTRQMKKLDKGGELIAVFNIASQQKLLKAESDKIKPILIPQIAELLDGLEFVQSIGMTVDLSSSPLFQLLLTAKDEDGSQALDTVANQAVRVAKGAFKLYETQLRKVWPAKLQPVVNILAATMKGVKATAKDNQVTVTIPKPDGFDTLPVLLKPVIDAARFEARRAHRLRNLKFIAIAIHTYHENHKKLPTNFLDGQGKPILSWRVRLLSDLDGEAVAANIKTSEPWDSETNKKALRMMPTYYGESKEGITTVLSFNGKRPEKLSEVSDPRKTLFAVMVSEESGVPWTKPSDLDPSPAALLEAVRKTEGDKILAMFYAGNLKLLPKDTPTDSLKELINPKVGP